MAKCLYMYDTCDVHNIELLFPVHWNNAMWGKRLRSLLNYAEMDIILFWDLPCQTSEGNFNLSEMNIHEDSQYSLAQFLAGTDWQNFLSLQMFLA